MFGGAGLYPSSFFGQNTEPECSVPATLNDALAEISMEGVAEVVREAVKAIRSFTAGRILRRGITKVQRSCRRGLNAGDSQNHA